MAIQRSNVKQNFSDSTAREHSNADDKRFEVSDYNHRVFELVVENVQDYAVFAMDLNGSIVSWNPGVEKLLGYQAAEFVGQNAAIIFTPEDRAAKAPEYELNTALQEGRCEDVRWHLRKDASRF